MHPKTVIESVLSLGCTVEADEDGIRLDCPTSIPSHIRAEIRAQKSQILTMLTNGYTQVIHRQLKAREWLELFVSMDTVPLDLVMDAAIAQGFDGSVINRIIGESYLVTTVLLTGRKYIKSPRLPPKGGP